MLEPKRLQKFWAIGLWFQWQAFSRLRRKGWLVFTDMLQKRAVSYGTTTSSECSFWGAFNVKGMTWKTTIDWFLRGCSKKKQLILIYLYFTSYGLTVYSGTYSLGTIWRQLMILIIRKTWCCSKYWSLAWDWVIAETCLVQTRLWVIGFGLFKDLQQWFAWQNASSYGLKRR